MGIVISRSVLAAVRAEAAEAQGLEVCGLLFGEGRIEAYRPTANVSPSPGDAFEIDPAALFAAIRAERSGGPVLAGYYHSHPSGVAEPSSRDHVAAAGDGKYWLIVAGGEIRLWRAVTGGLIEVAIEDEG